MLNIWGDFDVLNETLSRVGWLFTWVVIDLEWIWSTNFSNFIGLLAIQASHTFDFNKFNVITFLVSVTLILVNSDVSFFILWDGNDHEWLALLTILISDSVFLAKVGESVAEET